jgi:hypothetical protein
MIIQLRQQHFQGFHDFNFSVNGFDLNDLFGQIFGPSVKVCTSETHTHDRNYL